MQLFSTWLENQEPRRCFQDCAMCLMVGSPNLPSEKLQTMDEVWVVHGKVKGFDHCWLELRSKNWWFVWEPQHDELFGKDMWYSKTNARENYRLNKTEWFKLRSKYHHLGPYTEEELNGKLH